MHPTALQNARRFFETYDKPGAKVIDLGSQDVTGSLRSVCPHEYLGVDFVLGKGVDLILEDPYKLPFEDATQDIIVSSSCFEHSEMFWVLFLEILRVLKPNGLLYINVPSNGDIHRYPVDCWRFYPDAGAALVTWAERNGYRPRLLEHYTSNRRGSVWNDYVAVFVKDAAMAGLYSNRIVHGFDDFTNGSEGAQPSPWPQDQASLLWRVRRLSYFLRDEPRPVHRALSIIRDVMAGRRGSLWPNT